MKIVISIDSLKGSLSSIEAANAIKKGCRNFIVGIGGKVLNEIKSIKTVQ